MTKEKKAAKALTKRVVEKASPKVASKAKSPAKKQAKKPAPVGKKVQTAEGWKREMLREKRAKSKKS